MKKMTVVSVGYLLEVGFKNTKDAFAFYDALQKGTNLETPYIDGQRYYAEKDSMRITLEEHQVISADEAEALKELAEKKEAAKELEKDSAEG